MIIVRLEEGRRFCSFMLWDFCGYGHGKKVAREREMSLYYFDIILVPLTENRRKRRDLDAGDPDCRRASSRGLIPKAKVKTIKMTFVIVFGKF